MVHSHTESSQWHCHPRVVFVMLVPVALDHYVQVAIDTIQKLSVYLYDCIYATRKLTSCHEESTV